MRIAESEWRITVRGGTDPCKELMRRSSAFTLLEIMLALGLFALVAIGIYSSLMAIVKGSQVGLTAAAKVQRSRVAMRTIETALTCARSFDANSKYYWFVGENGSDATLSFVAKLPESFPRSGKFGGFDTRRVTFTLEPGLNSNKQLVLRQAPLLMDLKDLKDEMEHPVVLAKDVKTFGLEFWDGKSSDWIDEWDQTNRIPVRVRVTLQLIGDDAARTVRETVKEIAPMAVAVPGNWQRGGVGGPGAPGAPGGLGGPGGLPFRPPGNPPGGIR
jgi:type II secretion system protein J